MRRKQLIEWKKKVEIEWDWLQLEAQGLEEVHWPLLVRFIFDKLLGIINIPKCGVGFILRSAFSRIEKDDDLAKIIQMNKVGYAKPFRLVWDVRNWNSKSTKGKREKEMQVVCKYHELEMIHG
jgi:hypothetical protein